MTEEVVFECIYISAVFMDGNGYKGKGKQISFGIREPYNISKIEGYELPSDDDMIRQSVDQLICEVCMFNEHCYMGMCIASKEWREEMRQTMFEVVKMGGND